MTFDKLVGNTTTPITGNSSLTTITLLSAVTYFPTSNPDEL